MDYFILFVISWFFVLNNSNISDNKYRKCRSKQFGIEIIGEKLNLYSTVAITWLC